MNVSKSAPPDRSYIKPIIHGKIYRWCGQFAGGKRVLDVGCGLGDGAVRLSGTADTVVGIDLEISGALSRHQGQTGRHLRFLPMACQALAFPDESFDLVVANALIEYLEDVGPLFREVRRVLTHGGVFVCGTKNLERSLKTREGEPLYRNHAQEFTADGLISALAQYFGDIELHGEFLSTTAESLVMDSSALWLERILVATNLKYAFPGSWRKTVRRWLTGVDPQQISEDDFVIRGGPFEEAYYLIGVARKR